MIDREKVLDGYNTADTLRGAIAILQCAEDASNEEHVRTTIGLAVGMLLGIQGDIPEDL